MQNYNHMAHCTSKSCDKYKSCGRAMSTRKNNIDYLRIDEDDCVWYTEVKLEVEEVNNGKEETEATEV